MTVQLEIQTELEQKVSAKASAEGKSVEAYIQSLVEREIGPTPVQEEAPLTGAQKAELFREWPVAFPRIYQCLIRKTSHGKRCTSVNSSKRRKIGFPG